MAVGLPWLCLLGVSWGIWGSIPWMPMDANSTPPQLAVGAICVREGRLLLVRRGRGVSVGRWAPPGGRVEPGESVAAAVVRELWEETGLRGRVTSLCGRAERRLDGHRYVILNHWVVAPTGPAVAGDDAAAVTWCDRAGLDAIDLVHGLRAFLDEHQVLARLR